MTVAGRSPPSRWSCSSTFGARRMCSSVGESPWRRAHPRSAFGDRSMTRRVAARGAVARRRRNAPSSASSARSNRAGSSACSVSSGSPAVTSSPGLACSTTPAPKLDRVLLARPARAEPPGGDADRERVEPVQHTRRGRGDDLRLARRRAAARPGRRPAPRSSRARRPSPAVGSASAGSTRSARPRRASRGPARG